MIPFIKCNLIYIKSIKINSFELDVSEDDEEEEEEEELQRAFSRQSEGNVETRESN
jgi:hypothetical protein